MADRDPQLLQLLTASAAIENILSILKHTEKLRIEHSAAINGAFQKTQQSEFTRSCSDNNQESPPFSRAMSISFKDIVGNYDAKQALYENVVLPLTIGDAAKVNIFTGK